MALFRKEREAVTEATETAKKSINVSLVIACASIAIAVIALVVSVVHHG